MSESERLTRQEELDDLLRKSNLLFTERLRIRQMLEAAEADIPGMQAELERLRAEMGGKAGA